MARRDSVDCQARSRRRPRRLRRRRLPRRMPACWRNTSILEQTTKRSRPKSGERNMFCRSSRTRSAKPLRVLRVSSSRLTISSEATITRIDSPRAASTLCRQRSRRKHFRVRRPCPFSIDMYPTNSAAQVLTIDHRALRTASRPGTGIPGSRRTRLSRAQFSRPRTRPLANCPCHQTRIHGVHRSVCDPLRPTLWLTLVDRHKSWNTRQCQVNLEWSPMAIRCRAPEPTLRRDPEVHSTPNTVVYPTRNSVPSATDIQNSHIPDMRLKMRHLRPILCRPPTHLCAWTSQTGSLRSLHRH